MKTYYYLLVLFPLYLVPFLSFSQNDVHTILCKKDSSQTYSIYLPTSYKVSNKTYPVLIGFDPGAKGAIPVYKYKDIAEKYQFIIACSNTSRNGPADKFNVCLMIDDILNSYRINKNELYSFGFSGGGRKATRIAMQNKQIQGVINCGAGFPNNKLPDFAFNFQLIMPIGLEDMNFAEVYYLSEWLNKINMNHYVIPFYGEHNWPDKEIFEQAALLLFASRSSENNHVKIQELYRKQAENQPSDSLHILIEYFTLKNLSNFEKQIGLSDKFSKKLTDFIELNKDKLAEQDLILKQEKAIQARIINFFIDIERSESYNEKELNKIEKQILGVSDLFSQSRLNNFVNINAAERVSLYYNKQEYKLALNFNKVLTQLEPDNMQHHYRLAQLYSVLNDTNSSIKELHVLKKMGYTEFDKLKNDPLFLNTKDHPKFKRFLNSTH